MKKKIKITLITVVSLILVLAVAFSLYVSDYYRADETASSLLEADDVEQVSEDLILISSDQSSDRALIFYPGAKVEYTAYLPILTGISREVNISVFLAKMPFNLAIFDAGRAEDIMKANPDITTWYLGGHSMGGAMSSDFASKNADKVEGLILLGAYLYGDYAAEDTLTIYGTLNTSVAEKVDYTENVIVIQGGNHAQFGNYGEQSGDPDAQISREEQQRMSVEAIKTFIDEKQLEQE